ncbi:MAG: NADH-quinone oxidoreductase subunit NuoN [Alphaproteobacteria bacterium]
MGEMNLMLILPELFLAIIGMGFLIAGVMQGNRATDVLSWSTCISFVIAAVILLRMDTEATQILNGMLIIDDFAITVKILLLLGLTASLALSIQYLYQERIARFEYPVLIIFAGIGMMLMVSANNLLGLYMALELQSLALYVLAAFHRNSLRSAEAATKYFILGALSSGMLLFGISLIYGFTGSIQFDVIASTLSAQTLIPPGFTVGMVFVLAAIAFKVSAAPFHMWTPDVYQGAPSSVTAFFAIVPKIAALAMLIRLLFVPFEAASMQWGQVLYLMAMLSLVVGSFAAIAQDNIKRLMAYSSIGNMGYAMIGLVAGGAIGISSVLVFLTVYMFMTAGIFAVILCMRREGIAVEKISDLAGLSKTQPVLAYIMAALMFSMSGIPPLAGFFGKLFIFEAAIAQGYYWLATFGIVASVIAAFYYLRIIKVMFFDEPADAFDTGISVERRIILAISLAFILGFIIDPSAIKDTAMIAAESLLS